MTYQLMTQYFVAVCLGQAACKPHSTFESVSFEKLLHDEVEVMRSEEAASDSGTRPNVDYASLATSEPLRNICWNV